jgi:hypothetical protein
MRTQELTKWLTNNWRPYHSLAEKKKIATVKRSEALWQTQRDRVFEEIALLLGVERADTSTEGWFGQRLPAIRNILEGMTDGENSQLDVSMQEMNTSGQPEDIKRRSA